VDPGVLAKFTAVLYPIHVKNQSHSALLLLLFLMVLKKQFKTAAKWEPQNH
jgi:hypothetical protein